ncbi:high mobility group B protein 6-like isoform X2 [Salvia splendens]|uniref:high mobility group B protein 6-like isoform X2 n=1 Tax=Salvia splendens TaxID=180675 RepID=UPI001C263799|nr:high mobility group B protein 6-like isoform X2 [Salvia splendens]
MLVARSPISGHKMHHRPSSGRKPLQPKNSPATPSATNLKPNPNPNPNPNHAAVFWSEIDQSNKENIYSTPVKKERIQFQIEFDSFDASLAEELNAIREKVERLRIDKEKTDKMLRERALLLDSQMKEIVDRGMLQKQLEIEVDRLFRLKEIKLSCKSVSPIRSLRQKEQAKRMNQQQDQFKAKNQSEEVKEESMMSEN